MPATAGSAAGNSRAPFGSWPHAVASRESTIVNRRTFEFISFFNRIRVGEVFSWERFLVAATRIRVKIAILTYRVHLREMLVAFRVMSGEA